MTHEPRVVLHHNSSSTAVWLSLILAVLGVVLVLSLSHRGDGFDGSVWRDEAGNVSGANRRQGMYIAAEYRLPVGTPRRDVHDLLGAPDRTDIHSDICALGRAVWGIDLESMHIRYDTNNRVAEVTVNRT